MQIVVNVMGKRYVIDDATLYHFLQANGQCLDYQQPKHQPVKEVDDRNRDERVLLKG